MRNALVVVINYKNEKETFDFVKAVVSMDGADHIYLAVVNNATSDNPSISLECELAGIARVSYFDPKDNLGYMNGFLYGVEQFEGINGFIPYWVILSNTDIVFTQPQFFTMLLNRDYDDDVWCVGPSVINNEGVYANPAYTARISLTHIKRVRFFTATALRSRLYFSLSRIKHRLLMAANKNARPKSCYAYSIIGCFMIMRDKLYQALGGEKYGALLYSEESFVAEIIRENGKKLYYDDGIELLHKENATTGRLGAKKMGFRINESLKYIQERFYEK